MGVDYKTSFFFGAGLTRDECNRVYRHKDHVDAWYSSFGLDFRGDDEIAFVETGAAAYSGKGGQLFIAAKDSLIQTSGREGAELSSRIALPTSYETAIHEAAVKRFVLQHNVPVDFFGWFVGTRVH